MAHGSLPGRLLLLAGLCIFSAPGAAVEVTDNLSLGGALRVRYNRESARDIHKAAFDTLMFSARYQSDTWIGAARYRFYGGAYPYQYTHMGGVQIPEYAWIGRRFGADREIRAGLTSVPFGVGPLYSSSFFETLGNLVGLEDLYELGANYLDRAGPWHWQAGYFVKPAWPGRGTSRGTSYSTIITHADPSVVGGSRNEERDTVAIRLTRDIDVGDWKSEWGTSLYRSTLVNADTRGHGQRLAYGLHYHGKNGPWGVKLQWTRQLMTPRNPVDNQMITVGGYDGTFNLATRGNLYVADISYTIPGAYAHGWITGIRPFVTYSRLRKSNPTFRTSQRLQFGASTSVKSLYIALEWMYGRNDPYIGGSSYTQSLAEGGIDRWRHQLYMNVGYYF